MTAGSKIKEIRIKKGLTQKQLGDRCGIADSNIRKYENGKQNPKIETIQKIANALDVPISWFLDDDLFDAATSPDAEYEGTLIDNKFKSIIENDELSSKEKESMIRDLISQVEIVENVHEEHAEIARKYLLDGLFNNLNSDGKDKAIEQVELLTKIPEYQKEPSEE